MPLPLMAAGTLAAITLLLTFRYPAFRRAALWFAVAAVGYGAALSMVIAGKPARYQHYPPLSSIPAGLLAIVAIQAAVVGLGCWRLLRSGRIRAFPWTRVATAVVLSLMTAATVSPSVPRYVAELAFAALVQLVAFANAGLIAFAVPATTAGVLEDDRDKRRRGTDAAVLAAAAGAFVFAATLNITAYERQPHVPDEVTYLHHAKYLAAGLLTMPAPPVPAAFEIDLMEYERDRWFSPTPPGWPFALAAGVWLGIPWLVNPLLAGLNVLLAYMLLSTMLSRQTARLAAILLAASPWFVFLGMSFMPHQFTLFCALVGAVGIARARETGRWFWGAIAGAGIGAVSLIRPLDGVIVGGLLGLWAIGVGGARLRLASLAAIAAGTLMIGALVFPYNRMLTGDPLRFPINAYVDNHYPKNANAYGFGPDRGMGWPTDPNPGHTPLDGLININLNAFSLNTDLFGWACGSLILITWLVTSGRFKRQDAVMLAVVLGVVAAYFPYYFSGGPDFGARYWFPAIVALAALAARGVEELGAGGMRRAGVGVAAMSLLALAVFVPWRATDKYYQYRGMNADVRRLAAQHGFGPEDLVLVQGRRYPDYASAFTENPVDLRGTGAVYAWDRDAGTRAALLRAYGNRRVWVVEGPSRTGSGFRISAGPVAASTLLDNRY